MVGRERRFSSDPEGLARFEGRNADAGGTEASRRRAIYGLENMDGIPALVLELVEGKTLAERLATER